MPAILSNGSATDGLAVVRWGCLVSPNAWCYRRYSNGGFQMVVLHMVMPGCEHQPKSPVREVMVHRGGADSGARGGDSRFADAVAAVMRLPLSDGEKAEAVRRLLR